MLHSGAEASHCRSLITSQLAATYPRRIEQTASLWRFYCRTNSKLSDGDKVDSGGITVGVYREPLVIEGFLEETLAVSKLGATRSREWLHRVITLLEAAVDQLQNQEHPAQGTLLEAASLLRQIHPPAAEEVPDGRGRLLAWQARKVRDYIESHITGPVLVADLCGLVQRSEGTSRDSSSARSGSHRTLSSCDGAWN